MLQDLTEHGRTQAEGTPDRTGPDIREKQDKDAW